MDDTLELRQLAHLLRTGAELALDIAARRSADAPEVLRLVDEAQRMADELDAIASRIVERGGDPG